MEEKRRKSVNAAPTLRKIIVARRREREKRINERKRRLARYRRKMEYYSKKHE